MHHYYHAFTSWLYIHPEWGAVAAFMVAFLECIPLLGTVIPGSVTMTVIGVLVGTGVMPVTSTLICAIAGAVCGDSIGFLIGFYNKKSLKSIWPFSRKPHWLDGGQRFLAKHGGKSILIGRFVGPVRALVPLIAGALHISPSRFYLFDILSAIAWAIAYMLPGYLLGVAALSVPPAVATEVISTVLVGLLAIWIISWVIRITYNWLASHYNRILNHMWLKFVRSGKSPWLQNLLRFPDIRGYVGQLPMACLFLFFCFAFLIIWLNVIFHGPLQHWDILFSHLIRSLHNRVAMHVFVVITAFGEKAVVLPLGLTLFIYLLIKKQWQTAFHWLALVLIIVIGTEAIKLSHYNARPSGLFNGPTDSSFPSGHTVLCIGMYGFIAYLLARSWPSSRSIIYWIVSLVCIAIGISRLYLSAHWPTDIIAAILFASAVLSGVIISYRRHPMPKLPALGILVVTLVTIAISSSYYLHKNYSNNIRNYEVITPYHRLNMQNWWQGKTHYHRHGAHNK